MSLTTALKLVTKSKAFQLTALSVAAVSLTAASSLYHPTAVAAQASPASPEFYAAKVKPIFADNCGRCHMGDNHRGGLSLDTKASIMKGGRDGSVLVPGKPEDSLLIKLIRHEGPADDPMPMPPKSKISDEDIATVTAWVKAGAVMPE